MHFVVAFCLHVLPCMTRTCCLSLTQEYKWLAELLTCVTSAMAHDYVQLTSLLPSFGMMNTAYSLFA